STGGLSTHSDARGAFLLTGLAPGRAYVSAYHRVKGTGSANVEAGASGIEIKIAPPTVLTGRVVDKESGLAIPHFEVALDEQGMGLQMIGMVIAQMMAFD